MASVNKTVVATILLVEYEQGVRSFVRSLLPKEGYTIITATDGIDAPEKVVKHDGAIDLLLSDVEMPRMTGVELATQFFNHRPGGESSAAVRTFVRDDCTQRRLAVAAEAVRGEYAKGEDQTHFEEDARVLSQRRRIKSTVRSLRAA